MFVDDTQINISSNDINIVTNALNNNLKNVSDWLIANKLSLNTKKTDYMVIEYRISSKIKFNRIRSSSLS
jgi:hypothetical protein